MWMNCGHMGWGSGAGGVLGLAPTSVARGEIDREEFENKRRNLSL